MIPSDIFIPSYQHPVSNNPGNDADNKKKERMTPANNPFLVVETHLASMILRANNVGVIPFLPPTGANEVD
jgi:hypothetical protein